MLIIYYPKIYHFIKSILTAMKSSLHFFICACFLSLATSFSFAISTDSLRNVVANQTGVVQINSLIELSAATLEEGNLSEAGSYAQQALDLAHNLEDPRSTSDAFDARGEVYERKFDYTNAMRVYVEALKLRDQEEDQLGIAKSKNNIGRVFHYQEDPSSALENLNAALELRKSLNDMSGAAETHRNIADVYLFKKLYGKAKNHYRQSLDILVALNELEKASEIASYLGKIVSDLGDYEGALVYHNMSLDLNNSIGNKENIARDHYNIADALIEQNMYEEALFSNEMAYELRKEMGDKLGTAACYRSFGLIYSGLAEDDRAETYLNKSKDLLDQVGLRTGVPELYLDIAKAFEQMGDFKNAHFCQVSYSKSRDQLFTDEKARALLELTTKYESEFEAEKQNQIIATLEQEKVYSAQFRKFLFALMGCGVLVLLVLYRSYKVKQKDNKLLVAKNEEIERQKEEINSKNEELENTNASLDTLNQKLVQEMAERESIEQSSFARDRFLATMSHEMRTPINIIIGLTHLLLEEDPRDDQIEHLRTLQFSANNLVVFINDVLDFSKIEAGKLTLESRIFDPAKNFEEIHSRFKLPARDKGIKFTYNIDRKIPDKLMGDPTRLNQIATNLVGFALEETDQGEVNVEIGLKELSSKEAVLELRVADTSQGITQEKLDEMFRSFSTNNDNFEGYNSSQFGLAITKRLVDLQNGNIEVLNEAGKGTVFHVLLPYKLPTEVEVSKQTNGSPAKPRADKGITDLSGNKILLVEDNKINQLVVSKLLKKMGVEVVTANNGFEALDAFEESYFDLVLMDIQMPGMDGYRATAEIRKYDDPRKRDVPIIALTASAFLTEKEKAKLFGMNDHVGKPFGPEDLLEKISACLSVYKT